MHNQQTINSMDEQHSTLNEMPSLGKLVFFIGVALAMSAYGPFMLFAPAPIAMAYLIYGQWRTNAAAGLVLVLLFGASFNWPATSTTGAMFFLAGLMGYFIYRIIKGNIHPGRGLIASGTTLVVAVTAVYFLIAWVSNFSLTRHIHEMVQLAITQIQSSAEYANVLSQANEDVLEFKALLKDPKKLSDEIIAWLPAGIVVGVFLNLWASFYMVLRNSAIWRVRQPYTYGLKDLLHFKTPDAMIYLVIAGLILALGGDYLMGERSQVWGYNVLYSIGVLYFFQGLGVFLDFLSFIKIWGIFKTIIVISFLMIAWKFLMLVGLFDTWFNFRKYLVRKKHEGE